MKVISTNKAPQAIGPYSQAIITGSILYTSGQIPINPSTGNIDVLTIEEQTKQVLNNIKAILDEAGSSIEQVIKTTIFLKDMNTFSTVNAIYGEFFKNHKPARSTVEVSCLPKDVLIEIELIAEV